MYCVKCKERTSSKDEFTTRTKNGRLMLKGTCSVCNITKSKFIKESSGGSIINSVLNAIPLPEMHIKSAVGSEQVPGGTFNNTGKYSFCGPFTKLDKRLSEGYTGVNTLDQACLNHDIAYSRYKDTPKRNRYDDILAAQAANIAIDPSTPDYEKKDGRLVTAVLAAKSRFGLGLKQKYK